MFVYVTLFFAIFQPTFSVDPCRTPNGRQGDCKPVNQCPGIYNLFEKNDRSRATFLQQSNCGYVDGVYPKVCCPVPPNSLLPKECGREIGNRIFGGNVTAIDEYPWMALLMYQRNGKLTPKCGGFLITKRYVMTAKHCVLNKLVSVRLGEWDTRMDPDRQITTYGINLVPPMLEIPIEEKIPYDGPKKVQNDIALLRLNQDVEFSDFVKPICLPTSSDLTARSYLGDEMVVAGWGATEKSLRSEVKLKVKVPVVNCSNAYLGRFNGPDLISENPICAGGEKGKDSCSGDSGGPLMFKKHIWYAVGIVSNGPSNPCGQENAPALYVRVGSHVQWIISKLKP